VPLITRLEIFKGPEPLLLRVTFCAAPVVPTDWFPKERLVGERPSTGLAPIPERVTCWITVRLIAEMLRVPVRGPVPAGLKVTLILQLAPAATELPQLLL